MTGVDLSEKNVGVAAVVLLSVSALAGCFPLLEGGNPDGALSIRQNEGVLVIAACRDILVNEIVVSEKSTKTNSHWIDVWASRSMSMEMLPGETVTLNDNAFSSGVSAFRNPSLEPGVALLIFLNTKSVSGGTIDQELAQFEIPPQGLSNEVWLQPGGELTASSCSDDE